MSEQQGQFLRVRRFTIKGVYLKALFQIKNTATGKVVAGLNFEDKQVAKSKRRELNGFKGEGQEVLTHVITLGPDHDRYTSEKMKLASRPSRRRQQEEEVET